MAEYIKREDALKEVDRSLSLNEAYSRIASRIIAADVVEVVHREWRTAYIDKESKTTGVECSECGAFYNLSLFDFGLMYNYCPNCGADMRGDKDGEE